MRGWRGGGVGSDGGDLLWRGKVLRISWSVGKAWFELLIGEAEVRIGRLVGGECGMIETPTVFWLGIATKVGNDHSNMVILELFVGQWYVKVI